MSMYLRRRAAFSAGYAQAPPGEPGGGHNFLCELSVGGKIDPHTGMVVNIKDVDAVLKECALSVLDGKQLDCDVPAFHNLSPTLPRIARFIWDACGPALPPESRLAGVTLWATPLWWVELESLALDSRSAGAGETVMQSVTRAYEFSASHRLHAPQLTQAENDALFGKCNWHNGHGHNYEVEVTVAGEPNPQTGQIVPLAALDKIVDEEVLQPYDHRYLNTDAPEFAALVPTSENLTRVIWDKLARRMARETLGEARLHKVVIRETPRNVFEYRGE